MDNGMRNRWGRVRARLRGRGWARYVATLAGIVALCLVGGATASATTAHTLTVTKDGSGSGSVTSSPAGIDCGSACSAQFDDGTQVTLTAAADSGSTFTGWSGGGC
jgi:hypothetical protein